MKALPVAQLPLATSAGSTYYVVTPADQRGRLADRSPLEIMGWTAGMTISVRIQDGRLIIISLGQGPHAITVQGHLQLPLAVRRLCGIEPGDRLLVAASRDTARLRICTTDVLEEMLHHEMSNPAGASGA